MTREPGPGCEHYGDGASVEADLRPRSHQPGFRPLIKRCDSPQAFVDWLENPDGYMFAIPPTSTPGPGAPALLRRSVRG